MRRLLLLLFLMAAAACSHAQSAISGKYVVEPIIGFHANIESTVSFQGPGEDMLIYGGRFLLRRSYAGSVVVELLSGSNLRTYDYSFSPDTRNEEKISYRRTMGSIGIGSTLIDRDATGVAGAHALLGIGFVRESVERQITEQLSPEEPAVHRRFSETVTSPTLQMAVQIELELFSPRVLLRGMTGMLIGLNLEREEYESFLWLPGLTMTAGIGIAL